MEDYTWFKDKNSSISEKKLVHTYEACRAEALKYDTLKTFMRTNQAIYQSAKSHDWLKDFTWLKKEWEPKWNRETCYTTAKSYTDITTFHKEQIQCYEVARKNGWLEEYTWLEHKQADKGTWQIYENVKNEALKWSTKEEFRQNAPSAYGSALKHDWMKDFTWFEQTRRDSSTLTYDVCLETAKTCKTLFQYRNEYPSEYTKSTHTGWINDFTWLERILSKPETKVKHGTWISYDACYREAQKYRRYIDFARNAHGCYNSARRNGWIDDYTWLERNPKNNAKDKKPKGYWCVYENCRQEALKYKTLNEYTKLSKTAAESARVHGWLDDFTWLEKKFAKKKKSSDTPLDSQPIQ
jgi:hypothetical protein